ncbi:MAG: SPOR domain-containing protein [Elusimicrobiota bacterium]
MKNLTLFFALATAAGPLSAADPVQLKRIDTAPDMVEFDLTGPVLYKIFVVKEPSQIVVELLNTKLKAKNKAIEGQGLFLRRITPSQASKKPDWVTRVVLELDAPARYQIVWENGKMALRLDEVPPPEPVREPEPAPEPPQTPPPPEEAAAPEPEPEPPPPPPAPVERKKTQYWAQIGSFSEKERADKLAAELKAGGHPVSIAVGKSSKTVFHVVRVGPFQRRAEAQAAVKQLTAQGHSALLIKK